MIRKRPTKRWASASLVLGSVVAVLASPLALGSAAAAPTAITLTPNGAVTASTDTCSAYSVAAQDGASPAAGEAITLTVTETTTSNPGTPFSLYTATGNPAACGSSVGTGGTVVNNGNGTFTATYTHTGTLDASGDTEFGIASSAAGTGSVTVSSGAVTSAQANVTWTAGGADAVTTVAASPATTSGYTGSTATYTVTATNVNHNPVQGVTVEEISNPNVVNAGPDAIAATSCGATNSSGVATCTVHNGGTAGTDSLTFYVNNSSGSTHTAGPDSGEPQGNATAVFTAAPAVSAAKSTVTCVEKLSGANQGSGQASCTVPTTQTSIVFTATVEDASGNPISGASVNFAETSAKIGGTAVAAGNLTSQAVPTGTNGQATFTVSDPTPASGDNATVSAKVASTAIGSATAHWTTPVATSLSVQPALKSVQIGGTVSVTAQVVDQFGSPIGTTPALTYLVTGRNLGKSGTAGTGGVISYTDSGTVSASKVDTVTVTDATDHLTGSAAVQYTTVAPVASTVVVDTSGNGTTTTCGATSDTAPTNVTLGHVTPVCAVVKDSAGETLAGESVTFTVANGQVAANSAALTSASGTTYTATTDANGVAFAAVTSSKSGAQTVTAAADSVNGTNTVTYAAPTSAQAYAVVVSPTTATIAPGSSQKFTATVTDAFGNPVAGVSVVYTQTGAGSVGNGNNSAITAADGTVSVTVTTSATDSGAGTLSFSIAGANQCSTTGGTCTAAASYTVAATGASSLTLRTPATGHVGRPVAITGHATNASGAPMGGQLVRFYVGVGGEAVAIGSGTTGVAGNTTVRYTPTKAGNVAFAGFVDANNDQIREANEPTANASVSVGAGVRVERPVLSLDSKVKNARQGYVTIHVTPSPAAGSALVRYFVRTNGRWHQIRANYTGPGGRHAKVVITRPKGKRLTIRVKVARTASTTPGTSVAKSITVK